MFGRMRSLFERGRATQGASDGAPAPYGRPLVFSGTTPPLVHASTVPGVNDWYAPILVTAWLIGEESAKPDTVRSVLDVYRRISPDPYIEALTAYCEAGLSRYGDLWRYSDLVGAVYAAGRLLSPTRYLEIGVRRGRSMAALLTAAPHCDVTGFDYWKPGYAGIDNPGPEFVERELRRIGGTGRIDLVSGNSHETVPRHLAEHHDAWFDLITVDGDHSPTGAWDDVVNILPRLKVGGAFLFDDICHPAHPELGRVWAAATADRSRFSTWEYQDLGYGIGIAVRKR